MKDLSKKAMLVNLRIQQWSGKKYDLDVSRKVEKDHNAKNAGRFNKTLITDDELKEIQRVSSAARTYLYTATLPWGDNGDRLLPCSNYFEFIAKIREFKEEFQTTSNIFIKKFPDLKAQAKVRLNGMYQETDYPSSLALQSKFSLDVSFMPIPDTEDFRVKIDTREVEKLKHQIAHDLQGRIILATRNIWERIEKAVGHMAERLSDQEAVFHSTLVSNIRELIEVLPRLNFTNDPHITNVITQMEKLIIDPDTLRTDKVCRANTAKQANAILDKVRDYFC